MSVGLLDLPAPLYAWLDAALADFLPPLARILLWGVIAGLGSMALYALFAPQARIARGKREVAEAQRALDAHEGTLAQAGPLIARMLRLALGQVRLTTLPAVIASLPLLTLLAWMSTAYGHRFPEPGETPPVEAQPPSLMAEWVPQAPSRSAPGVVVRDGDGSRIGRFDLPAPVNVLHEWRWWNAILGNPAGYLPSGAGVQRVRVDLPRRHYLGFGPQWARGWEVPFLGALLVASIALKFGARIQ